MPHFGVLIVGHGTIFESGIMMPMTRAADTYDGVDIGWMKLNAADCVSS